MANNYQFPYGQQTSTMSNQFQPQQLFPQPQGNVYTINNSLEVANVPMSGGLSVALCLPEGLLYLKSMQNGNPMFMVYKITPYDNKTQDQNSNSNHNQNTQNNQQEVLSTIVSELQSQRTKITSIEKEIETIKNNTSNGGKINELI